MNKFPLYTNLSKEIKSKRDLTIKQKEDFMNKILIIDDDGAELLYTLIRFYYIEETNDQSCDVPYKGILNKKSIKFDLENFPFKLKHILYKFVNMHLDKMNENNVRNDSKL
jgi:hypothetical protein